MIISRQAIEEISLVEDFADRVLAAAVYYAEQGLYVMPIRPNGKAIPKAETNFNYTHASNKPTTVAEWYKVGGKFRGWNIGLACGAEDGTFAIDVDPKDHLGRNGFETLAEIENDFGKLVAPVQRTPSGGLHYLYKWFDSGSSSTCKIGGGIDTRGGNGKCRSHIVVWPSMIDGAEYKWEQFGEVPDAPDWVADLLGTPWDKRPEDDFDLGNENVGEGDVERQFTPREIWAMLTKLDPDTLTYDEWLKVGQAIHSQHPNDTGLKMWDSWSAKGERYKSGECTNRWNGFKSYGPIRIGTLIYMAQKSGYVVNPKITELEYEQKTDYEQLIDELNEEWGIVVVGGKVRVIGKQLNSDPEQDLALMSLDDFKSLTANKRIALSGPDGKVKPVPKTAIWLADERRREFMGGVEFAPDKPLEYDSPRGLTYNLWRGWQIEPKAGDWSKLKQHIFEVICNKNEFHFTWLLDWVANFYQDPANPPGTAVVMKGNEGSGKGTLFEAIGRTIGRHYKHITNSEQLTGRFNGHMQDALLVFADEVVFGGDKRHAGMLKAMVTEKILACERKGVDTYMYKNMARVGMASNEDWFIPAGPSSRRWFVLRTADHRCGDRKWFDDIYAEMSSGGLAAMMHELMGRKITTDLKLAPETDLLQDQRMRYEAANNSNIDSVFIWWAGCLEQGTMGTIRDYEIDDPMAAVRWPSMVNRMDLYDNYLEWCKLRGLVQREILKNTVFYSHMKKFGAVELRPSSKAILEQFGVRPYMFKFSDVGSHMATFNSITNNKWFGE